MNPVGRSLAGLHSFSLLIFLFIGLKFDCAWPYSLIPIDKLQHLLL